MTFPFVSHILASIQTWWKSFDPVATIKHAVDTLNSLGLTQDHIEAIATEVIAIKSAPLSSLDKALHVAETVADWQGDAALPPQAQDSLHAIITLVHLIAKLSGKL